MRNSALATSSIRPNSTGSIVTYAPDIEAMGAVLGHTPDEFAAAITEEERGLCGEACTFDAEFAGRIMKLGCAGCKSERFRQVVDDIVTVVRSVSTRHESIAEFAEKLARHNGSDSADVYQGYSEIAPSAKMLTSIYESRNPKKTPVQRLKPSAKFL